ncbi:hypothetical protein LTR62_002325 [Meristemomyces frigidus]|uniref:Transcription factor domain-containing protein n=1 Tax=Meristemomyces frigidus TaxID=1508187 RepID=A0AAN7T8P1_9PEZI|nr:hypothetical protein LTR62_002325 [Meristemomyces frigidus]
MGMMHEEMEILFSKHPPYDELELLATVQALIVYAIAIYYSVSDTSHHPGIDDTTFKNIHGLLYRLASSGILVTEAETRMTRPTWEEWIILSAKRRTVLTMYAFESVYTTIAGLPTFPAYELRLMPVPGAKSLWQAPSRAQWEEAYDSSLKEWGGPCFVMRELNVKPEPGTERAARLQRWLEDADEFSMMLLMMVTACE